jgi:hypothetical protein
MVENTATSRSVSGQADFVPIIVLFALLAGLLALLLAPTSNAAKPYVLIWQPADHAVVPTTFTVKMAASGLKVEPAGAVHAGAGHFHLLIDKDFVPVGQPIPLNTPGYMHFGKGQTEATLTLPPGEHTIRLQFANGAHMALDGDQYRYEITVTVQ